MDKRRNLCAVGNHQSCLKMDARIERFDPTHRASTNPGNRLGIHELRGISGFNEMIKHYEVHAPLKRNVLPDELGATGAFLASDGAAAITGQVLYVDCGYQIMGM